MREDTKYRYLSKVTGDLKTPKVTGLVGMDPIPTRNKETGGD